MAGGAGKVDAMQWIFRDKRADVPAFMVLQKRPDTIFFTDKKAIAKL